MYVIRNDKAKMLSWTARATAEKAISAFTFVRGERWERLQEDGYEVVEVVVRDDAVADPGESNTALTCALEALFAANAHIDKLERRIAALLDMGEALLPFAAAEAYSLIKSIDSLEAEIEARWALAVIATADRMLGGEARGTCSLLVEQSRVALKPWGGSLS